MGKLKTFEALKIPESKETDGLGKKCPKQGCRRLTSSSVGVKGSRYHVLKCSRNGSPGCCGYYRRSMCKTLITLNVFVIVCLTIYTRTVGNNYKYYRPSSQEMWDLSQRITMKNCNFPVLEPFAKEVQPFLRRPSLVNCIHEANTGGDLRFTVDRGTRILRRLIDDGDCCYRPFYRINDGELQTGDECHPIKDNITEISDGNDFIEVFCMNGRDDYRDGFSFVTEKPDVENWTENNEKAREIPQGNRMNLIIFGIDATSHMNFLRTMPKSHKYLIHNLSATVLNGYTKVAENTLPNVIPLLTGLTFEEFKARCVDSGVLNEEVHLDNCPFIWKRFEALGYRTSFAEDDVDISIFNMNWRHAFVRPPTHYYLRPFSMMMQYKQSTSEGYCYGTRLSFKVLLDNIEHTASAFIKPNQPYFQFTWTTKLSHGDYNKLNLGDQSLRNTLDFLKSHGHLNNTVLIVMSDHGSRLDDIRETQQGQIEDRMPLFYIVLPKWFREVFPKAVENLRENSNRLTSAFDVHETIKDIMELGRLNRDLTSEKASSSKLTGNRRPQSLFEEIPSSRTCFMAGVPMHWCLCHGKSSLDVKLLEVKNAVSYVIGYMNHLLSQYWSCSTLTLGQITDAFTLVQDEDEVSQSKANDLNNKSVNLLQVSFITNPGQGSFEATVIHDINNERWTLTEQPVRTNSYEGQSYCVPQELKEFCYCKL